MGGVGGAVSSGGGDGGNWSEVVMFPLRSSFTEVIGAGSEGWLVVRVVARPPVASRKLTMVDTIASGVELPFHGRPNDQQ
jgi:hypothetical protein